jgi:hypothetical protein
MSICTPKGFQTLLEAMTTTGAPKYVEVFPVNVGQFPAAFKDLKFNGTIDVLTGNLKNAQSVLPDSIYSADIDGIVLGALWNQINPAAGVYDWSVVDLEITRAVAAKKTIAINVTCGAYTPDWLLDEVPHATFLWGNHDCADGGTEYVLPAPWAPAYTAAYAAMMLALSAHLKSIPGAYAAVNRVRLTGINTLTDELHLAFCSGSNGLALWQGLGYTPAKILGAAKTLLAAVNAAFPDKLLSQSIIQSSGDLPLINNAGKAISDKDPTFVNVKELLVDYALSVLKNRFAVQWNGFQTPAGASQFVLNAAKKGALVGWQTNEDGGTANGAECP